MKRNLWVLALFYGHLFVLGGYAVPSQTNQSAMVAIEVTTSLGDMSSEATEDELTAPLETLLATAPSLREMRSSSAHGVSTIWLQFKGTSAPVALQWVRHRVAQATSRLPAGVHGPVVTESNYPQ